MSKQFFKTKYMEILLPIISKYTMEKQKESIIGALYTIDGHNHTDGHGKRVTPAGIVIDGDLVFNNDITEIKSIQLDEIPDTSINQTFFIKQGDFYTRDAQGNEIQLTRGASFNTGSGEVIGGDYTSSNAEILYDDPSKSFYFTSAPGFYADINIKELQLRALNNETVTLKSNDAEIESFNFNLPSDGTGHPSVWKIDNTGQVVCLKHESLEDDKSYIVSVGEEFISSPLKLEYFPEGDNWEVLNVSDEEEVTTGNTAGIKLPIIQDLEEEVVEGVVGVAGGKIKLFTNQWVNLLTQDLEGISFDNISDVNITDPQDGEYLTYDPVTKTFSNQPYPNISFTELNNPPTDITDLSLHNLRELKDVSNVGWASSSSEGYVLKWNNLQNGFLLSPDGGGFALWGEIGGDVEDNAQVMDVANQYLTKHDPTIHLDNINGSLFDLQDVAFEGENLEPEDTGKTLVWRRDEPESEENFEGKFMLEALPQTTTSPFKNYAPSFDQFKRQLYGFNKGVVTGLPITPSTAADWVTACTVSEEALPVIRHLKIEELGVQGGGLATFIKMTEHLDNPHIINTLKNQLYKIEIYNKGTEVVGVTLPYIEAVSEGCAPGEVLSLTYFEARDDGQHLTFQCSVGFTGVAYVYVLPVKV